MGSVGEVPVLGSVGLVEVFCPPDERGVVDPPRGVDALPRLIFERGADRPPPPHQPKARSSGAVPSSMAAAATEIATILFLMRLSPGLWFASAGNWRVNGTTRSI